MFRKRLSLQFAVIVLIISATTSVIGAVVRDRREMHHERVAVESTVEQFLDAVQYPAAVAAYELDQALAQQIVTGLVQSDYFSSARIVSDFGDDLATAGRRRSDTDDAHPDERRLVPESDREIALLSHDGVAVGFLAAQIDAPGILRAHQAQRARHIIEAIVWSLALIFSLTAVFLLWFLRPLVRLHASVDQLVAGDGTTADVDVPFWHSNDEFGELARTVGMLTEQLQGELRDSISARYGLESSLAEKETLLREIHHRVKNNLQVVLSLLSLESSRSEDHHAGVDFVEVQEKVHAMALVHEHLYQSKDLTSISVPEYTRELVESVQRVYPQSQFFDVRLQVDPLRLNLERAVPFGLILNELISNAFKHVGVEPTGASPVLRVSVSSSNGSVTVVVADRGPGLPEDFQIESSATLGMHLIGGLASQLQADLTLAPTAAEPPAGLTVSVSFSGVAK